MKIELSREEFDIIAGALDYQIQEQTKKIGEMHQDLNLYSKKGEDSLKEMIEAARKVLNEKFDPIYNKENKEYFEQHEFILATEATEKWGLKDSTIRRAIFDGRIKKEECKKEGRDWKITIAAMKRLYGEPKK
mgnify:FL=1